MSLKVFEFRAGACDVLLLIKILLNKHLDILIIGQLLSVDHQWTNPVVILLILFTSLKFLKSNFYHSILP